MPEQDNDKLEQFFRKAASKAEVAFNEEDWKKLETRLDAVDAGMAKTEEPRSNVAAVVISGLVLLFLGAIWVNSTYNFIAFSNRDDTSGQLTKKNDAVISPLPDSQNNKIKEGVGDSNAEVDKNENDEEPLSSLATESPGEGQRQSVQRQVETSDANLEAETRNRVARTTGDEVDQPALFPRVDSETGNASIGGGESLPMVDSKKIHQDLILILPAKAEKNKQKAVVKLPGAEGVDTREADAMVKEEHASDHKEHVATPRLSLLLSYAPDFSSTSLNRYSAPGNAFGAMIHYHIKNRWSISTGVIKNFKQYTGNGEDYKPPKGYWKYYTNGIIPESIDGSCNILEFPVMVQYTLSNTGRNKWLAGAGVSSYLMLNESYHYNFNTPNPGAREGWDSKQRSRFLLNMVNFTIGYEHQVVPGLMIGVEPYLKVPLEEIGWSNLKLYSTGASVSMRYTIVRRKNTFTPIRSRGPD